MKKYLLLFCIIILVKNLQAQIPPALASQLQNVLNIAVTTGSNNGVSAYLKLKGGQTWSGTAGVNGQSLPITDTTVFHGASTTKLNIAVLMLMLAQSNLVNLDSSWYKYVKTLSVAFNKSITIRQLLNHTSGIKDYLEVPANNTYITSNFSAFYTPKYILENIVSGVPDFPPGTNFNYSSSNYVLAALVAEAATGNPVQTELRNRIWNPLKMKHTYFGAYDTIPDPKAGVWWNFGSGLTNYSSQPTTSMLSYGYGGANIVTCPKDLTKLVDTLMNGLLTPQSMTDMLTFVPQSYGGWWTAGYGLGVHHLLGQKVDTLIGHDGYYTNLTDVFHSSMCGVTLVTMTNTERLFQGIYNSMYNVIRGYYVCNMVPVANFYATPNTTCPGNIIVFKDSSTNVRPTSWLWNFPGGILTGSTTVTDSMPQVIYNVPGVYPVSYTATAAGGSNSITKTSYITIYSNIASYNASFLESFETVASLPNPDWSLATGGGTNWASTMLGAATGTRSAYIDNFTNTAGNKSSLTSASFDLSGFISPKFSFKLAYQQKASTNADKLQILTSTNCGQTWTVRLTKIGSSLVTVTPPSTVALSPTSGQFVTTTVNIAPVSASTNVRFRFDFYADAAGPGNNIFIDDINIFDAALSIESNEDETKTNIYPNPTSDNFFINANTTDKLELNLYDLSGKNVLSTKVADRSNINTSALSDGIYSLSIKTSDRIINKKLVIIH